MILKTKKQSNKNTKTNWCAEPSPGHAVQFYCDSKSLIADLYEYVSTGLTSNATCLVIASKKHIEMLNKKLGETKPRYVAIDAYEALESFMHEGMPDKKLFNIHIGNLVHKTITENGLPLRAYSEMVSILWEQGNRQGVIELEKLWNNLAIENEFSLYCAYPELHFIMDEVSRLEISNCHNLHVNSLTS